MSMSAKELAPTEDQGVIFGIVNAPANATIESNQSAFADAAGKVFMSFPQTRVHLSRSPSRTTASAAWS